VDWQPPAGTRFADALELVADPVTRLIVRHDAYELDVLAALAREVVGESASVVIPGEWTVELSAAGVNKAAALAELTDAYRSYVPTSSAVVSTCPSTACSSSAFAAPDSSSRSRSRA
jgi:hypothetical protein